MKMHEFYYFNTSTIRNALFPITKCSLIANCHPTPGAPYFLADSPRQMWLCVNWISRRHWWQFLSFLVLELAQAWLAHHMPAPNVNRIARESQAHSECEVIVGLLSRRFGDEVHVEARLLGLIIVEVMRIARRRIICSHVASKIKLEKLIPINNWKIQIFIEAALFIGFLRKW